MLWFLRDVVVCCGVVVCTLFYCGAVQKDVMWDWVEEVRR